MPDRLSKSLQIRLLLASFGALFGSVAFALGRLSDGGLGRCLGSPDPGLLHCPWCYAAAAFLLAAALPLPRRVLSRRSA